MNSSRPIPLLRHLQTTPQHPPAQPVSQGSTWRRPLLKHHCHDTTESLTQQELERGRGDSCKRGKHKATGVTVTSLILGNNAKGESKNWNERLLIAAWQKSLLSSHGHGKHRLAVSAPLSYRCAKWVQRRERGNGTPCLLRGKETLGPDNLSSSI